MSQVIIKNIRVILTLIVSFIIIFFFVKNNSSLMILEKRNVLTITALGEKNEKSLGNEVWISNINSNNILNLNKINHDENWIFKDNCLVYSGNKESSIKINITGVKKIDIFFMKHAYGGKLKINNTVIDLYSEKSEIIDYGIDTNINISLWKILVYSVIYTLTLWLLTIWLKKRKLIDYIMPLLYYFSIMYLICEEINIKYLALFFPIFISYFVLYRKENKIFSTLMFSTLIYCLSKSFIVPLNFSITSESIKILYIFVNISFISILLYVHRFGMVFITKLKEKDPEYIRWFKISMAYFTIILIFLILIWPGNWIWDEKSIFISAQHYLYNSWQSYVMVLIYSWSLMLIPYVSGIVIIISFIISIILGYIMTKIYSINKNKIEIIILFTLLLLPPVTLNILYPLRNMLYASIELLFLFNIYYIKKQNMKINNTKIFTLSSCIIFISFVRTEGIYYLLLGPLIIILLFKKEFLNLQKIITILSFLILSFLIYYPIKYLDNIYPNNYILTSLPNPLSIMLQNKKLNISDSERKSIDKVFDIELLENNPSYTEITAYHLGATRENYREYFNDFLKTYLKLILKNPGDYLLARSKTFLATTGMDKKHPNNSPWSYLDEKYDGSDVEILNILNNDKFSKPYSYKFRNKVINILKGTSVKSDEFNLSGQIIWNFLPSLILMIYLLIKNLLRKKTLEFSILLLALLKVPLVFITAPANYFFYYLSIYLIGIFILASYISKIFQRKC